MNDWLPPQVRSAATALIAIAIFVWTWLFRFNDPGGSFAYLTDDHFFYLVRGWQILLGELPVRDFVDHGAPLYYYVGAAVQIVFGRGTLSEIAFSVTILAASAAALFFLAVRASGSRAVGLAATAWHVLLEPRYYNYPKILVYIAAIPAIWWFIDRPDRRRIALIAAITAIAFLFRHDHGVFVAAAFFTALALLPSSPLAVRLRYAASYVVLVLVLLAPYLAFIQANGGVVTYLRTAAAWAERDRNRAEVVWPGLTDNPDGISESASSDQPVTRLLGSIHDNQVAWLYYGELALPFVTLALVWLSPDAFRRGWRHGPAKLTVVAVLGTLLNAGFLRTPLAARLADPSVPHTIMFAWLVAATIALARPSTPIRTGASRPLGATIRVVGAGTAVVLLAVLWIAGAHDWYGRLEKASIVGGKAVEQAEYIWRAVRTAFPIAAPPSDQADTTMALAYYLRECTTPDDRVFMQHYLPQVLALSERGFAGGHADLRPGFFTDDEMQRLTVARLARQQVPIALVGTGDDMGGFRKSFPLVTRYLDEHYRNAGERVFDGRFDVRLLVRVDRMPVRTYEPFAWPCFR